jgi:hypothetical protein
VGDCHLAVLCAPLVDEGGVRLEGEVLIVYLGGELGGIDVWSVSLVLLRGAGAPRREHEHRSHECAQ